MANRTDVEAQQVHGTNPQVRSFIFTHRFSLVDEAALFAKDNWQFLIEKIIRQKVTTPPAHGLLQRKSSMRALSLILS